MEWSRFEEQFPPTNTILLLRLGKVSFWGVYYVTGKLFRIAEIHNPSCRCVVGHKLEEIEIKDIDWRLPNKESRLDEILEEFLT